MRVNYYLTLFLLFLLLDSYSFYSSPLRFVFRVLAIYYFIFYLESRSLENHLLSTKIQSTERTEEREKEEDDDDHDHDHVDDEVRKRARKRERKGISKYYRNF